MAVFSGKIFSTTLLFSILKIKSSNMAILKKEKFFFPKNPFDYFRH